ncbi:DNA invertase Pin-like site-specific DNA recombinase [Agrobacterium tumefaciens]|uniref:Recombinase family protein n=2 Tax=Rhizobium/Agrobacterium group TaxID=227290 RepID=A0AAJ4N5E8_AGRTU|nr:DNA invertase Pin-like site-specific DNA recombinase [Agrobacterium radiobacter]MBB4450188.1 DNA invertase Pin-like site-specific DNA recombinase [Agrobacterium radiobacter]MBP2540267.1 DNA invertase Pin-like site-specific DNA recombinase [Agrobacterium tumefaciens]QTG15560.1 recombinase family protein [Agrobacterium tumefaciens]
MMVIDWSQKGGQTATPDTSKVPAATYVRMSTEHQKYSTDNQMAVIRRYAEKHGFEIVRSYADEGKSGLRLVGRDALQNLLSDVEGGHANYRVILVYDVSRWGRFQDPDEAAEVELRCKRQGILVHYCAEQFENDGSMGSSIIKTVKRAMAGEYSRELSVKVFNGQANLIRLGYRQGGAPGFGLRRQLIDQSGNSKGELARGQHKSIATDRVILVPGPDWEVAIVQRIYDLFVSREKSEAEIAAILNDEGVQTDWDRGWTRGTIHQVLINEKYVGNNVWGRTSFKLKQAHVQNPEEAWIRADSVFTNIVSKGIFLQAKAIIASRSDRLSDDDMLRKLATVLGQQGYLSGLIIDEAEDCPSSSSYAHRFGSLLRAYALVGFVPDRDYRYLEINRALRRMHPLVLQEVIDGICLAGGIVQQAAETDLLTINQEFSASIVIVRCIQTASGALRWKVRLDSALRPDITVVVRMGLNNVDALDYYLMPSLDMHDAVLRLCEFNGLSFDAYRCDDLSKFYAMAKRRPFMEVAR